MQDWSLIRTQLETWVQSITGLPTHWNKRPRGWLAEDSGYAILRIIGRRSVGLDSTDYEYDDTASAGEEIVISQCGHRQFTFEIQVRTWRQSDDVDALHYTTLLRNSTSLPQKSVAVFDEAEIDFVQVLNEVDLDEEIDGRDISIANLDLLFNSYSEVEDTATGYVETLKDFEFQDLDNTTPPLWTGDVDIS